MAAGEMMILSGEGCVGSPWAAEGQLVQACCAGNPHAFARLVALHEQMVHNLALRLTGDPEEARDVSQEVFLQVYRTLPRFEGRSSLKTWIYRIVVNQALNRQRFWRRRKKDRVRPIEELSARDEAWIAAELGGGANPYDELRRAEVARELQNALLGIPFEQRAILLLKEVEGLSCEEIGASLGIPEGTVKSRLSRARETLRKRMLGADGKRARP